MPLIEQLAEEIDLENKREPVQVKKPEASVDSPAKLSLPRVTSQPNMLSDNRQSMMVVVPSSEKDDSNDEEVKA